MPAPVSLQEYIAGSSRESPGASVQGIITGEDNPDVAMQVTCRAVRMTGSPVASTAGDGNGEL